MRTLHLLCALILIVLLFPYHPSTGTLLPGKGWLGVYVTYVPAELREELNLEKREGVLVREVVPYSPADEAGIEEDDIILKFGGKKIRSPFHLARLVRRSEVGERVEIEILRDGESKELEVEIGERGGGCCYEFYLEPCPHGFPFPPRVYLGVKLQELNEDLAKYFGVAEDEGVLITEVERRSPAAKAGLKPGDIITKIDGERVRDPEEVWEILRNIEPEEEVPVEIIRHGERKTLRVELKRHPCRWHFRSRLFPWGPWEGGVWFWRFDDDCLHDWIKDKIQHDLKRERERLRRELEKIKLQLWEKSIET